MFIQIKLYTRSNIIDLHNFICVGCMMFVWIYYLYRKCICIYNANSICELDYVKFDIICIANHTNISIMLYHKLK